MFSPCLRLVRGLGVVLGIVAAAAAPTQQPDTPPTQQPNTNTSKYARPSEPPSKVSAKEYDRAPGARGKVQRIEEMRGSSVRVRYFVTGDLPAQDRATLRELERAENERNYLNDLGDLKQQYVNDERTMEPFRRGVQQQLYGRSITNESDATNSGMGAYGAGYNGYGGFAPYGWGGYAAMPFLGGLGSYGAYGPYGWGGYGYRQGALNRYMGHSQTTTNQSLANGVGDEGRMKTALAPAIAAQMAAEYADDVEKHYEKAMNEASSSPVLSQALRLRTSAVAAAPGEPSYTKDSTVTVWTRGDKITGVVVADGKGWVVLKTDEGEMRLRKSSIERSLVRSKPAAKEQGTVTQRP